MWSLLAERKRESKHNGIYFWEQSVLLKLTLLHSEWLKLHATLAVLSAKLLRKFICSSGGLESAVFVGSLWHNLRHRMLKQGLISAIFWCCISAVRKKFQYHVAFGAVQFQLKWTHFISYHFNEISLPCVFDWCCCWVGKLISKIKILFKLSIQISEHLKTYYQKKKVINKYVHVRCV